MTVPPHDGTPHQQEQHTAVDVADEVNAPAAADGVVPEGLESAKSSATSSPFLSRVNAAVLSRVPPDACGFFENIIGQFFFSLMALIVKLSGKHSIGTFEILWFRSLIQLIFGTLWAHFLVHQSPLFISFSPRKLLHSLRTDSEIRTTLWLLFLRGFLGTISTAGYFFSLAYLSLSDAILVSFIGPIFTAIFGWLLLKEKVAPIEILGMGFSLTGILLVAKPPFLVTIFSFFGIDLSTAVSFITMSSSSSINEEEALMQPDADSADAWKRKVIGMAWGIMAAFFAGITSILIRKLGKRKVSSVVVVNWFSLIGLLMTPPLGVFVEQKVSIPSTTELILLVSMGTVAFLGQLFYSAGMQTGKASLVIVANYTSVIWGFVLGIVFLSETLELFSILGAFLIFSNAILIVIKGWKSGQPKHYTSIPLTTR